MATDQLPQLPEATRHEPIYQDPEKHPLRIGGVIVGLRPLYTAEEATAYADARVAHALAADRARAVQPADLSIQAAGEREAFVSWLSGTYPNAWPRDDAERIWRHNHVAALAWRRRASLSTPASGEGWKPIETAPTERCMCLVLIGEQVHVAQFNPRTVSAQWWNAYGIPSRLAHTPTHWRPLPPAPTSPTEPAAPLKGCAANRDGDCVHAQCPQLRDGEPRATGRHCPLDTEPAAEGEA